MENLIKYVLHLADSALILGHRHSEWTGHGPNLEQDIALSNIALDNIGQARLFYQYAASLINENALQKTGAATEDTLAYFRDPEDFTNWQLVELKDENWSFPIVKQFFVSAFQYPFYKAMQASNDETLAAIAEKSLKEVTYHLKWSSEWMIRLGDGTEESHAKIQHTANRLWPYTHELFVQTEAENALQAAGKAIDPQTIYAAFKATVDAVFDTATLTLPDTISGQPAMGKTGNHSEYLEPLLKEMQILQRTYPNCEW